MKVNIGEYGPQGERVSEVHIDDWDTWSMDVTLAYIIVPMLIQLRDTCHGAPLVADEDVPEVLRRIDDGGDIDEFYFDRWDYVLNEMIFAFKMKAEEFDALEEDTKRISNGFRLFGKYYSDLWD